MTWSGAYQEQTAHAVPRCRVRHWFTVYGAVGLRRPDCARCGTPNPKWAAVEVEMRQMMGDEFIDEMLEAVAAGVRVRLSSLDVSHRESRVATREDEAVTK